MCSQAATPSLSLQQLTSDQIQLTWPAEAANFALEQADGLAFPAAWLAVNAVPTSAGGVFSVTLPLGAQTRFFRLRGTAPVVTTVIETSPAAGELGVAVTRETIFRFSAPLAAETLLTGQELFAEFGGRQWLARTELSSDGRTATLFFLENLPASARVRVTLDGNRLRDADGLALDADGDGQPGGMRMVEFDTSGLGGLPGTAVIGHVFASAKQADGSNQPLVNATITVNGAEQSLRTTTDETGYFKLEPAPAGRFFVHIDGRTVLGSQWPDGAYYPFIGKAWSAVAGRTNNLAGGSGEIFLPLIQSDALQPVSATEETRITFSPSVLAANPALAGVEIMVPANALFADNGARGGKVGIAPVPPDRLPEPLPSGLSLPLVITIQTDGGSNFDVPVPVKFPNLPDPVSGVKLPPGGKTVLWSFNHDSGHWEPQGSMTITADGQFAVTDPGVGVRQPGWHSINLGSGGGGPDPAPPGPPPPPGPCDGAFDCDQDGCLESAIECDKEDCDKYLKEILRLEEYCSLNVAIRNKRDAFLCGLPLIDCPDPAWQEKWDRCREAIADAQFQYTQCLLAQGAFSEDRKSSLRPASPSEDDPRFAQERALTAAAVVPVNLLLGSPQWTQMEPRELDVWAALFTALAEAARPESPAGLQINEAESTVLFALPLPTNLTPTLVQTAIARLNVYRNNTLAAAERMQIDNASAAYATLWAQYRAAGWRTTSDGHYQIADEQSAAAAASSAKTFARNRRLHFRLADLATGFELRGQLNAAGRFDNVILVPDTYYTIEYLDPVTGATGSALFRSAVSGQETSIPATPMTIPTGLADTDGDGLPDALEGIPGTRADLADTDGDGAGDWAELQANSDPANGTALSLGLVNAATTSQAVVEVAVGGDFAVAGVGVVGSSAPVVSVFNVRDPLNPVKVAELSGGGGIQTLAADGGRAAFTDHANQLHLVELEAPGGPRVSAIVPMPGRALVALGAGRVFTAPQSGTPRIEMRDAVTGAVIAQVPAANPALTKLLVHDGVLYATAVDTLGLWEIQAAALVARGTLRLTNDILPGRVGLSLFVEDGRAYVGTFKGYRVVDVSNAGAPVLIGTSAKAQAPVLALAHNGSGRLVATSLNGLSEPRLSLYGATNPTVTTNLLANWLTAGLARGLVLHRGFALVADTQAGLSTVNYLAPERGTNPPTIALRARVTVPPDRQEGGRDFGVVAVTTDDVQVRDVEFYVDDVRQQLDGGHPFTATLRAPLVAPGKTTFTVRAKATDTAGNSAWSISLVLKLEPDMTPPKLLAVTPDDNTVWLPGELTSVTATFSEAMSAASLGTAFRVFALGPDEAEGTADDVLMPATLAYPVGDDQTAWLTFAPALPAGRYFARVTTAATDVFNNAIAGGRVWRFEARGALTFSDPAATAWLTAVNWLPARVPDERDIAFVPVGNAGRTVASGGDLVAGRLDLRSGLTLGEPANPFAAHKLTVRTRAELAAPVRLYGNSSLNGPGVFHNTSTLELLDEGDGSLVGATLLNDGVVRVVRSNEFSGLYLRNGARFVNQPGGLLELVGPAAVNRDIFNVPTVENSGRIVKRGAGATVFAPGIFIHTGLVRVEGGELMVRVDSGSILGGAFEAAAGTRLGFTVGNFTSLPGNPLDLGPNSRLSGAGDIRFEGSPTVQGAVDLDGSLETWADARFSGPVRVGTRYVNRFGEATFSGQFAEFTGPVLSHGRTVFATASEARLQDLTVAENGGLTANGIVLVQGTLSVSNKATFAGPRRLSVFGPANFQGTISGVQLTLELGGVTTFLPGASLNLGNARVVAQLGSELRLDGLTSLTAAELRVFGRLTKTSADPLAIAAGLTGTGEFEVAGGSVDLAGQGTFRGTLLVGPQASLRFTGLNQIFDTGSSLICEGQVVSTRQAGGQSGASNIIRGEFSAASVLIGGRLLRFDGNYTLPEVIVDDGEFGGDGTVTAQKLVLINNVFFVGTGTNRLFGATGWSNYVVLKDTRTFENFGHVVVQDEGRLVVSDAPRFFNRTGAILEFRNDNEFINSRTMPLVNEGTLLKSAGDGQTTIAGKITNSGTIELRTGRLQLDNNNPITQTAGLLWLNGGVLRGGAIISGGLFRGNTTGPESIRSLRLSGTAELEIAAPGSELGQLAASSFSQDTTGVMHLDIAGATTAGVDFDELFVNASPAFRGRLNLRLRNGYQPPLGQKFAVLRWAGARNGSFDSVTGEGVPAGRKWKINYEATQATVELAVE